MGAATFAAALSMRNLCRPPAAWGDTARRQLRCSIHARALSSAAGGLVPPHGIIELRDYTVKPEYFEDFVRMSGQYRSVRMLAYPGFLG